MVETIAMSAEHIATIANSVLDVAVIEGAGVQLDEPAFSPRTAVRRGRRPGNPHARAIRVDVEVRPGPTVPGMAVGDPPPLRQLLRNFSPTPSRYTPEIADGLYRAGRRLDRGEQIRPARLGGEAAPDTSAERRDRLLERCAQLDPSTARNHEGTGLRPVICRALADLMGG
jgi:two-component system sensor histidine kinase BarA